MNARTLLVPLLICLLSLSACNKVTPEKAVAYNDAIVDIQAHVVAHFDSFVMRADTEDSLSAINALKEALDSARMNLKKLEAIEPFDNHTELRDAAIALVKHYIKGLDEDFRNILGTITNHNSTLEQLEHANEVRDAFAHEEDRLFKAVEEAQKSMAKTYHFDFEPPKAVD